MDSNTLINTHRLLVIARFDISNGMNLKIIEAIIKTLSEELGNSELVTLISEIEPQILQQLVVQEGNELEVSNKHKAFMIEMLKITFYELKKHNFDVAYDIIDMLHVLPEIMPSKSEKTFKDYFNVYVKPVIKKWKFCKTNDIKKYFFKQFTFFNRN